MRVSVVMPVHNGADYLKRSLPALLAAKDSKTEIIVIDDASDDESFLIASQFADQILQIEQKKGSAVARNYGVKNAKGELIFFVDADVMVKPDAIKLLRDFFQHNPEFDAIIGSYDETPWEKDFFSQYRNLIHHYFHQTGDSESETFWSGCGAIKKDAFWKVSGFDGFRFTRPSIEDIEFGYRLRKEGIRIRLEKNFQAKHLKKWTFISIIKTDIFFRALPWSRLLLEKNNRKHTLNADFQQKLCAVLIWLTIVAFIIEVYTGKIIGLSILSFAGVISINWRLHKFFLNKRGIVFTVCAFLMQILYYLYSSLVFAYCLLERRFVANR